MFNFLKKKSTGKTVTLKISGMHCTSCGMNIDSELEELSGVISADTSYAKAQTVINYDPAQVNPQQLKNVIESLDYSVNEVE